MVVVTEVEAKCKAGNLIWRLAEGSVASSPVALVRWYADSRQLYIINSHKYANSTTARETRERVTFACVSESMVARFRACEYLPRGFAPSPYDRQTQSPPILRRNCARD